MAAMTLDHLSGGRFILGIGASGPQVVEGWYGQPYPKPLARTREYVEIIRRIVRREAPVEFQGEHYSLPSSIGTGLGKPLKPTVHPLRTDLPIYLAAEGPKNVALAAEIGDGWLPLFFAPKEDAFYRQCLAEGFAASGDPSKADRYEVPATVTIVPGEDAERCADALRPFIALYAGGMGAKGANFHFDVFARMGYEAEATKIQELYLAGRRPTRPRRCRWRWWRTSPWSVPSTRSGPSSSSGTRPASPRSSCQGRPQRSSSTRT
jgi:F420-dependent oxidoreductase-like protein